MFHNQLTKGMALKNRLQYKTLKANRSFPQFVENSNDTATALAHSVNRVPNPIEAPKIPRFRKGKYHTNGVARQYLKLNPPPNKS